MRKTLAVIVTLVFLFNLGGYYFWFGFRQYCIRKEIKQQIRNGLGEDELTVIIFEGKNGAGLDWIRPGKEFNFKGKMYDVVKSKVNNGKTFYFCINDKKEKKLIDQRSNEDKQRKETEKQVKRVLSNFFIPQVGRQIKQVCASQIVYPRCRFLLKDNAPEIPSPPPKPA